VVVAALVAGTPLLAATLAVPEGDHAAFAAPGLAVAATWIAGGLAAGPRALGRRRVGGPLVLGGAGGGGRHGLDVPPGGRRRPGDHPRDLVGAHAPRPPPLTTRSKRATTSTCGVWGKASTTVASTSR